MVISERLPAGRQLSHESLWLISYWEVILKSAKGKLDVGNPRAWWETALSDFAATAMPLRPVHAAEIHDITAIHNDPFDRALIAQATVEELVLVTTDERRVSRRVSIRHAECVRHGDSHGYN